MPRLAARDIFRMLLWPPFSPFSAPVKAKCKEGQHTHSRNEANNAKDNKHGLRKCINKASKCWPAAGAANEDGVASWSFPYLVVAPRKARKDIFKIYLTPCKVLNVFI